MERITNTLLVFAEFDAGKEVIAGINRDAFCAILKAPRPRYSADYFWLGFDRLLILLAFDL